MKKQYAFEITEDDGTANFIFFDTIEDAVEQYPRYSSTEDFPSKEQNIVKIFEASPKYIGKYKMKIKPEIRKVVKVRG